MGGARLFGQWSRNLRFHNHGELRQVNEHTNPSTSQSTLRPASSTSVIQIQNSTFKIPSGPVIQNSKFKIQDSIWP
jgi:hypothetical protein